MHKTHLTSANIACQLRFLHRPPVGRSCIQVNANAALHSSNFDLKTQDVALAPSRSRTGGVTMSVRELEALRTERNTVPASKHGLEAITGASCETGAQ
jgi:hypothetical protein